MTINRSHLAIVR